MAPGIACAQQNLIGSYQGGYEHEGQGVGQKRGQTAIAGVKLEIKTLEGDRVTGTWHLLRGKCQGEYPVSGSYRNGQLVLQAAGGAKEGCANSKLRLTADGEKLVGTYGKHELTLSK